MVSIINLLPMSPSGFKQPTHPGDPPVGRYGNEQLRFRDLFGFSTPEVYRDPGRPEKP